MNDWKIRATSIDPEYFWTVERLYQYLKLTGEQHPLFPDLYEMMELPA